MDPNARFFKLINPDTGKSLHLRYMGINPEEAAHKAYYIMTKKMKERGQQIPESITICLKEYTQCSTRDIYDIEILR